VIETLEIRSAGAGDAAALARLLAAPAERRALSAAVVARALAAIETDADSDVLVAEEDGRLVAAAQLTFVPGRLTDGRERLLLEGLTVAEEVRGRGIGRQLAAFAVNLARARGCALVQVAAEGERGEARRFLDSLGFAHTCDAYTLRL
jgi:GNAT superfamily N-acetyltransferase